MDEELNINDLPTEVLCEILGFLDFKSMLNASLVCCDWNDIISTSNEFLNKTRLTLTIDKRTSFKLTRKYRDLKIVAKDNCTLRKHYLDQINKICGSLETLTSMQTSIVLSSDFVDFLNCCTKLKTLELWNLFENLNKKIPGETELVLKLPKLTRLIIHDADWLLKYLEVENLNFLLISRSQGRKMLSQDRIVRFLNKIKHVNGIVLRSIDFDSEIELKPKFAWNYLKISEIDSFMYDHMDSNWQMMMKAARRDSKISLEENLETEFVYSLLEIVKNQRNITKMKIELLSYPLEFLFEENSALKFVKSLKIRKSEPFYGNNDNENDDDSLKASMSMTEIMKKFKNVEYLDMKYNVALAMGDDHTDDIEVVFDKVKHLKIDSLLKCSSMWNYVTYPRLETLELDIEKGCVHEFMFETGVGINNTRLRKLIIHYSKEIDINSWKSCLKRFATVQFFEVVNKQCRVRNMRDRKEIERIVAFSMNSTNSK